MDYDGARPTHNLSFNPTNHSADSQREVPKTHTVKSPPRTGRSRLAVGQNRCRRGVSHKGLRRRPIGGHVPYQNSLPASRGAKSHNTAWASSSKGTQSGKPCVPLSPTRIVPVPEGMKKSSFLTWVTQILYARRAYLSTVSFGLPAGNDRNGGACAALTIGSPPGIIDS